MSKHFLDSRQAAGYFGISQRQFERDIEAGLVKVRSQIFKGKRKRQRFYLREDVEAARKGR